jgi:hypothetical protein
MATHGSVSLENCHPFLINESLAFAHNGILSDFGSREKSDTIAFMEEILRGLPNDWWENDSIRNLIALYTKSSFLAFLTKTGKVLRTNIDRWTEEDGIYYSNTSFRYKKNVYVYTGNHSESGYTYRGNPRAVYNDGEWYDDWKGNFHQAKTTEENKQMALQIVRTEKEEDKYDGPVFILNHAGDVIGRYTDNNGKREPKGSIFRFANTMDNLVGKE